jgi:GntR family transcriptional regulator
MFTADVPKWRQLADIIRERIASGEYQPRQPIPSEHQLVLETGLSRSTVQKALKALRDEGAIYSVHGLGTFVAERGQRGLDASQTTQGAT